MKLCAGDELVNFFLKGRFRVLGLVLTAGVLSAQAAFADIPWELRKNHDGIMVHTRRVEGSPILEYKGQMKIQAPIEQVLAYFEQEDRFREWFHQCSASHLVREENPDRKIIYFVLDLPWPVSDRDVAYLQTRSRDAGGTVTYQLSAVPHEVPHKDGLVRVPYLKAYWRFTPQEDGGTLIYFQQHGNVGGHIPAPLVNRLAVEIPYQTLRGLARGILSEKTE